MAPLIHRDSRTSRDTTTSRLSANLMSLSPTFHVKPLCQRGTTRPRYKSHLHIEMEPSLWSVFATSYRRKRLRQAYGRLLLLLGQWPVYTSTKTSFTRRNCVLETVKKREMWSPNFSMLPRSRIKTVLKYKLCYQPVSTQYCLECHTSETEITPPLNLVDRKWYQQVQLWCETWPALYQEWHMQPHQC